MLLNPDFTFETFVVGKDHSCAHAAAWAAANAPATSHNPLFIHGRSGLGKTHLLHAIGNHVLARLPASHVTYLTMERFLNDFVKMVRTSTGDEFRRRYQRVDVLLIDDLQFLAGREHTQEELFHTINGLMQWNTRIVLASDIHPLLLPKLMGRLTTRFAAGAVTQVQAPDFETRLAILCTLSAGAAVQPSAEVLELIATQVDGNVFELEGALNRVIAYQNLEGRPLPLRVAGWFLRDTFYAGHCATSTGDQVRRPG